jgi:hypothetical protein
MMDMIGRSPEPSAMMASEWTYDRYLEHEQELTILPDQRYCLPTRT